MLQEEYYFEIGPVLECGIGTQAGRVPVVAVDFGMQEGEGDVRMTKREFLLRQRGLPPPEPGVDVGIQVDRPPKTSKKSSIKERDACVGMPGVDFGMQENKPHRSRRGRAEPMPRDIKEYRSAVITSTGQRFPSSVEQSTFSRPDTAVVVTDTEGSDSGVDSWSARGKKKPSNSQAFVEARRVSTSSEEVAVRHVPPPRATREVNRYKAVEDDSDVEFDEGRAATRKRSTKGKKKEDKIVVRKYSSFTSGEEDSDEPPKRAPSRRDKRHAKKRNDRVSSSDEAVESYDSPPKEKSSRRRKEKRRTASKDEDFGLQV